VLLVLLGLSVGSADFGSDLKLDADGYVTMIVSVGRQTCSRESLCLGSAYNLVSCLAAKLVAVCWGHVAVPY